VADEARIPRHRHRHRLARHACILTSDTRDFLKLLLWQAAQGSRQSMFYCRPTRRHPRDDSREDVVGVGVVECGLEQVCRCSRAVVLLHQAVT